ncbi:hypothetical protein [Natronogracilivirga saccharolytica]|uniref:Uncharacterized protein n=1 Tax=Natronogracilivirga saccharolytica TaxID=2812953 RepID=A0A8J7RMZ1_9BACT|nr:hypothetical protein [Natronogracilivirga saccharolytica]MBP3193008.1 hypothetical protein [Natronogracilivirga saccharolytica]
MNIYLRPLYLLSALLLITVGSFVFFTSCNDDAEPRADISPLFEPIPPEVPGY